MRKLNNMTDEELALAYVGGDNRAFDLLLSRNEEKLFSYILFVVHDEDLANDIFQETFVKAISRLHAGQYSCSGKFISWLIRIAHNVIIDGYRSHCVFRMVEQAKIMIFRVCVVKIFRQIVPSRRWYASRFSVM